MRCSHTHLDLSFLANENFGRSIDPDPGNVDSLLNRGIGHLNQEETEAAVLEFIRVISLRPYDAIAHLSRVRWTCRNVHLAPGGESTQAKKVLTNSGARGGVWIEEGWQCRPGNP